MVVSTKKLKERRKRKNKFKKFAERTRCRWCTEKTDGIPVRELLDYKNVDLLQKVVTSQGKIFSRKRSTGCARHQQMLKKAVKQARIMALMPYTG